MTQKACRSFTLVELLIVILILGVLAAVIVPKLINISLKVREMTTRSNLNAIRKAMELYRADYGIYPCESDSGIQPPWPNAVLVPVYLPKWPREYVSSRAGEGDYTISNTISDWNNRDMPGWFLFYDPASDTIIRYIKMRIRKKGIATDGSKYEEW